MKRLIALSLMSLLALSACGSKPVKVEPHPTKTEKELEKELANKVAEAKESAEAEEAQAAEALEKSQEAQIAKEAELLSAEEAELEAFLKTLESSDQ